MEEPRPRRLTFRVPENPPDRKNPYTFTYGDYKLTYDKTKSSISDEDCLKNITRCIEMMEKDAK